MIKTLPLDIGLLIIFLTITIGVGRLVSKKIKIYFDNTLSDICLSWGLGLFIFSYLTFILGYLKLLYFWIFVILSSMSFLLSQKQIRELIRRIDLKSFIRFFSEQKLFVFILLLAITFNFLFNYCPPTDVDEVHSHLGMPRVWAVHHKIYEFEGNHSQYMPLTITMLYLFLTVLRSPQTARLLHWCFGILCTLVLYHIGKKIDTKKSALLGVIIFYTMPLVTSLSGKAHTDLGAIYFALLSVYSFLLWREKLWTPIYLVLSAFFAGASLGCRYNMFPFVVIMAFLIPVVLFKQKSISYNFKMMCLYMLIVGAVFAPWMVRNFILTGNPLYPIRILPKINYSNIFYVQWTTEQIKFSIYNNLRFFILMGCGSIIYGTGALITASIPFIFLRIIKSHIKIVFFASLLYIFFVINLIANCPRRSLIGFALLPIIAAVVLLKVVERYPYLKKYFIFFISLTVLTNLSLVIYFGGKRIPVFLGLESKEHYIYQQYKYPERANFVKYINQYIEKQDGIFFLGSFSVPLYYYPNHRTFALDSFSKEFYEGKTWEEVLTEFKVRNIKYILLYNFSFNETENGLIGNYTRVKIPWFNKEHLLPVLMSETATLYKIKMR